MIAAHVLRGATVALLALALSGTARAGPAGEVAPDPVPESEVVPVPTPAPGTGLVLMSRVGTVFATTFFRPPLEELAPPSRAGEQAEGALPVVFAFGRVTPNPLFGRARIGFDLPVASRVTFEVLDVAGRAVRTLVDGPVAPGRHSLDWDGTDAAGRGLSPGIYFLRMDARAAGGTGGLRRVDKVLVFR